MIRRFRFDPTVDPCLFKTQQIGSPIWSAWSFCLALLDEAHPGAMDPLSSHAVLKPQFPLLYYDKAQSNMAHKALLDVVPPTAAAGICPLCSVAEC